MVCSLTCSCFQKLTPRTTEVLSLATTNNQGIVETDHRDEHSIEVARKWIKNCLETHAYCNRTLPFPQKRIMPSRLIDIGSGSTLTPRLCTTEALPADTKYVTLSHCWGDYSPLILTEANKGTFLKQIDVSALPKTFKDAMEIASSLGQRYIWIDSLCIIQDSLKDWEGQAVIMGDVYHNSWCNIAATAALDSRFGCFMERSPLDVLPCKIRTKWTSEPEKSFFCSSFDIWKNAVESSVLNHRAWVCQEVVLAPRVVHFAKCQMFWECLELRACETYPQGLPNNRSTKMSLDVYCLRNEIIQAHSMKFKRYQLWAIFVNDYSRRKLSKPQVDKLVAISGLARKLIVDGRNYVAGLWKEILPYQLMWTAHSDPELVPGNLEIPSWSWASLNKQVYTRAPRERDDSSILIRIISVNAPLVSADPFGQVNGGLISIEGPLIKTIFRPCIGMYMNKKSWLGTSLARVYPDRGPFLDGSTVYCLTIEVNKDGPKYGIVLKPVNSSKGLFRRCGYFAVFDLLQDGNWVRDFDDLHQSPLEPEDYEEALGLEPKTGFLFYRFSIE